MLRLRNIPVRSQPTLLAQPSRAQPPAVSGQSGARHISLFNFWKGASSSEHTTERSKKGDTHDPTSSASASGMKEREVNEGIADASKSQGTTERGGLSSGQKAKKEIPEAPEPIIGMNDERAQVRPVLDILVSVMLMSGISIPQKGNS